MTSIPSFFDKKDRRLFLYALLLVVAGYTCMALDPEANGFGPLTLWVAPPLLLLGFLLPVGGLLGTRALGLLSLRAWRDNRLKNFTALALFLVSLTVYVVTLEPTASLWDCSEFISSAYKLQVPHTPGTPLSLLLARVFTGLSLGRVENVAWSINFMSAVFSAGTVVLAFFIQYALGRSITGGEREKAVVLAAAVGSLCLAFSDTFWFSAVEAETYGAACFFLLLLVWLVLKGKDLDNAGRERYLVLIAYVAGLAYCIHPMCLLALPVLPFLWYTATRPLTWLNVAITACVGFVIVFLINRLIAVGFFELGFSFDRFFVNTLGLPFYTGAVVMVIMLVAGVYFLLRRFPAFRAYTWAVVFLTLGFAPYAMLFIRSGHNPPIDETNPEDLYMIKAYMNRESYPTSPLVYGPYYDANIDDVSIKSHAYHKGQNAYEVSGGLSEYNYEDARETILPRLYSRDPAHVSAYRQWIGLNANERPTFSNNLYYLFTFQLGHMYFRYWLWNFAGRESDVQDSDWLRPWDAATVDETNASKARNQYWSIPLLLGIAGMFYQYKHHRKGFVAVTIFFLITGVILALYINAPPVEPRERDYIYVGSYIAFALWVGLGVLQVLSLLPKRYAVAGIATLAVPLLMLYQNYDDHNRAGRTFQIDNARNTLRSCAPNAILFTGGDNDTFPLWYVQEIEGFRTDVRIMVLSYFNTDWYIQQLTRPYYSSPAFKLSLDEKAYRQYGPNDVLYIQESIKDGIDVKRYLQLLKAEHPALRAVATDGESYSILPSKTLRLQITNTPGKTLAAHHDSTLPQELVLRVTENYLQKNALAVLDLLVSNGLERPMYFNYTSLSQLGMDLNPYVVQEGPLYRLYTQAHDGNDIPVDKAATYKSLVEDADYSNLKNAGVYFSHEDFQARMISPVRLSFNTLALAYLQEGDNAMAEKVMQHAFTNLYYSHLEPSFSNLQAADIFIALGKKEEAKLLAQHLFNFNYDRVQADVVARRVRNDVDVYLLSKAAETLTELGDTRHVSKMRALDAVL